MMDPNLRAKIEENCPNVNTEQIYYPDNIKKTISTTGKFLSSAFTVIGGYLKTGVEKAGGFINEKISSGPATTIQP